MAGPVICDECHENDYEVMISRRSDATTEALCLPCFTLRGLALAIAVMPAEVILEAVGPVHLAQEKKPEGKPAGGRGRKSEPEPEPEPDPEPEAAEGLATEAAAGADG